MDVHAECMWCDTVCVRVCETVCETMCGNMHNCLYLFNNYMVYHDIPAPGFVSPSTSQNTPAMTSTTPTQSTPIPTTDGEGRYRSHTMHASRH